MDFMVDAKQEKNFMDSQAYVQDATVMLAAGLVERSADLIRDGWIRGTFYKMVEGKTPVAFCILGALEEAMNELMPATQFVEEARRQVHDVACAFILDEVEEQTREKTGSIPGWNDSGTRTQEEVVSVMEAAASRLWDISLDSSEKLGDITRLVSSAAQRGAGLRTAELTLSDNN
jgi:hypothetical protein